MLRQDTRAGQHGMGMVEVVVSLLLLAVAILGFSAMQMRAVKATDETLIRSDAMVAVRNIAENMRLHPTQAMKIKYLTAISRYGTAASHDAYASAIPDKPRVDCAKSACTEEQQVQYTAHQAMKLAADNQMMLNAMQCPGNSSELLRICLIASWGQTKPTVGGKDTDCISDLGAYNRGSSCVVLETY